MKRIPLADTISLARRWLFSWLAECVRMLRMKVVTCFREKNYALLSILFLWITRLSSVYEIVRTGNIGSRSLVGVYAASKARMDSLHGMVARGFAASLYQEPTRGPRHL